MIRLNLLRKRKVAKPKSLMWQFWLYIAVIFVTLVGVGAVWTLQNRKISTLEREKARLANEIKVYEKYDKILKDLQAKLSDVNKRAEIVSGLIKDRDNVVRFLALLAILVPEESMWIEEINISGNQAKLTGYAKNNETIVEFIRSLEASYFVKKEGVNLIRSKSEVISENIILSKFELELYYNNFSDVELALKAQDAKN